MRQFLNIELRVASRRQYITNQRPRHAQPNARLPPAALPTVDQVAIPGVIVQLRGDLYRPIV